MRIQSPLAASDYSEPEPDVAVVPPGSYRDAHPGHAFLVIEVAEPSLRKDRAIKAPLYAAAGIREYWIVDLAGEQIEVNRALAGGAYTQVSRHGRGDVLRPEAFPDIEVRVADVLG